VINTNRGIWEYEKATLDVSVAAESPTDWREGTVYDAKTYVLYGAIPVSMGAYTHNFQLWMSKCNHCNLEYSLQLRQVRGNGRQQLRGHVHVGCQFKSALLSTLWFVSGGGSRRGA